LKISFSLYGDLPKYCIGAIRNAELAPKIYPGWKCVFYCDIAVPEQIINKLKETSEVIIIDDPRWVGYTKGMWRFFVQDDYVIYRDCDSRLNEREADAVMEWIISDKTLHTIHDNINHTKPILAGLFGLKGGLKDAKDKIIEWNEKHEWENYYGVDESILTDLLVDLTWYESNENNLKIKLNNNEFCGQSYFEDDTPQWDYNVERKVRSKVNNKLHEILRQLPDYSDGLRYNLDGRDYPRPYQTIVIEGKLIRGLRLCIDRQEIFELWIKAYGIFKGTYLDIGCQLGFFPKQMSYIFDEVTGIDCSKPYINACKLLHPEIADRFILQDANDLRIVAKADVVTALSMIEYIIDKEKFVKELFEHTNQMLILEGHAPDMANGTDKVWEKLLTAHPWKQVAKWDELTEPGLNATYSKGRPIWICLK
jgi:2-polyprenyl-3-methyl-5-hydroxy-6-metoxy-1,4-benzoquinol methylase